MEQRKPQPTGPLTTAKPATDSSGGSASTHHEREQAARASAIRRVGRFEILSALGKGAFGEVWRAYDPQLDREVAIKFPRFEHAEGKEAERFFREARAAGRLRHPHIVNVHDAGQIDGQHYIASAFVDGQPLSAWLKSREPRVEQAVEIVVALAEALHYAHSQGVFHRDIKPANIMIDRQDQPRLMDFGLARRPDDEATLTVEGAVLGTPAYMSPEQAAGESRHADARSDLYSLGVVLYEMLARRRPFEGSLPEISRQVLHEPPPPPRKFDPRIPVDLEVITLKCLNKERERRYPSAQHLADELRRWQRHEPIQARPPTWFERVQLWKRRRPREAAAAGAAMLAAMALVMGLIGFAVREQAHGRRLADENERVNVERRAAQQQLALNQLDRGLALCDAGDAAKGLLWFARALESAERAGEADLAWTVRMNLAAWRSQVSMLTDIVELDHDARFIAPLPDGSRLIVGGLDRVTIWDQAGRQPAAPTFPAGGAVYSLEINAAKNLLLIGTTGGEICLRRLDTGELVRPPIELSGRVFARLSPDGGKILALRTNHSAPVSENYDVVASLIDVATGAALGPEAHLERGGDGRFSPDGTRLLLFDHSMDAVGQGSVKFFDAAMQQVGPVLSHFKGGICSAEYSPDGRSLLTSGHDRTVRLWNVETGQPIGSPWPHEEAVRYASFSPDGTTVATIAEMRLRIWNVATGEPAGPATGLSNRPIRLIAASDEFLSGGHDFNAHIWDEHTGQRRGGYLPHADRVEAVALSADARTAIVGGMGKGVRFWRLASPPGPPAPVEQAIDYGGKSNSPDGSKEFFSEEGKTGVRDVATQAVVHAPVAWRVAGPLAISNDASIVAHGRNTLDVHLWRLPDQSPIGAPIAQAVPVVEARFNHAASLLATTGYTDSTIRLWGVETGRAIGPPLKQDARVTGLAFSADDRTLYTRRYGQQVSHPWPVTEPAAGDPASLLTAIEALTGLSLDANGATRTLDSVEWLERIASLDDAGRAYGPDHKF